MGIHWAVRMDMCAHPGGARRGSLAREIARGPRSPLRTTERSRPAPPTALLSQAGPQAASLGSSVCEARRTLENFPPNVSLLDHALMYVSTSQPLAIKTHTPICPPQTCLKIDLVLKQTHRRASQNPDWSHSDEAGLLQPLQTEDWGGNEQLGQEAKATRCPHW